MCNKYSNKMRCGKPMIYTIKNSCAKNENENFKSDFPLKRYSLRYQ